MLIVIRVHALFAVDLPGYQERLKVPMLGGSEIENIYLPIFKRELDRFVVTFRGVERSVPENFKSPEFLVLLRHIQLVYFAEEA